MEDWDVKNSLENYHRIRKALKRCEDKTDEINAKRFKAGGSIAKMPENPVRREVTIIDNLDRMEKNEMEKSFYVYYKGIGDQFLEWVRLSPELKQYYPMVRDKYVDKAKSDYLEMRYHYSRVQIFRIINGLVKKFVGLC